MINFNPFELCIVEKNNTLDSEKIFLYNNDEKNKLSRDYVNLVKLDFIKNNNNYSFCNGDIIRHEDKIYLVSIKINDTYETKTFYNSFGFYQCSFGLKDNNDKYYFKIDRTSYKSIENIIFLKNYKIVGNMFVNNQYLDIIKKERFIILQDNKNNLNLSPFLYLEKHYIDTKDLTDLKRFNLRIMIKYYHPQLKSIQYGELLNQKIDNILNLQKNKDWSFILKFNINNLMTKPIEVMLNTVFVFKYKNFYDYFLLKSKITNVKDLSKDETDKIKALEHFYVGLNPFGSIYLYSFNGEEYPLELMINLMWHIFYYSYIKHAFNFIDENNYVIINDKENSDKYEQIYLLYLSKQK